MRSKGFTLIELLAVIVILAIIAVIAVPVVLNIIDETKKNANKDSVILYAKAVNQAITKTEIDNSVINGKYSTLDGKKLTRNKNSIEVEYDGSIVVCKVIVITDGDLFLNDCTVNGQKVDYSYGSIKGDINGDGLVTEEDLDLLRKYIAGTTTGVSLDKVDLNGDGKVTSTDVFYLRTILNSKYDINSDGVIDEKDSDLLSNSTAISTNDKADVNGDGIVDEEETEMFQKYFKYNCDINGDGVVNCDDLTVLRHVIAGTYTQAELTEEEYEDILVVADLNGDGRVRSTDALLLKQILANYYDLSSCQ